MPYYLKNTFEKYTDVQGLGLCGGHGRSAYSTEKWSIDN